MEHPFSLQTALEFALDATWQAGHVTLRYYQTPVNIETKTDNSPVTVADKESEQLLRNLIANRWPTHGIIGEEFGSSEADYTWIIDPIDGTKSFVCGVPLYATLLSYEQEGAPVVGVAYFPALDLMVHAEIGTGAYANGRPIHVSTQTDLKRSVFCVGSHRSLEQYGRADGFQKLARASMATRTWCDAYGHCLVAMGRVEGMIDPIVSPWDLSAVGLIVEEAGGRFTDFSAKPRPQSEAVSTNGVLHDFVLEQFQG